MIASTIPPTVLACAWRHERGADQPPRSRSATSAVRPGRRFLQTGALSIAAARLSIFGSVQTNQRAPASIGLDPKLLIDRERQQSRVPLESVGTARPCGLLRLTWACALLLT